MSRLVLSAVALAALAACSSLPPAPAAASGARSVQITRTQFGIAHVTAPDWEGIGFGVAYANAQDNVCQTAQQLVTVRGERSLFFGPQAQGQLGLRMLPNATIDMFVRSHMDDTALARAQAGVSADAKAAARGYVAGYNQFLKDTGAANLPAECRNAAWVRQMTEADLARITEQSMILAGVGLMADGVVGAAPPAKSSAVDRALPDVSVADAAKILAEYSVGNRGAFGGELGSNGWAFGRNATPDGAGVVLGNPHFPWVGTNRFWEMHITIPGRVDAMGAAIGNSPVVQIGFNHDVAWTHTVSTGKRFTLYELKLDPQDPMTYIVDGQRHRIEAQTVSVPMPNGAAPLTHTVYRSQWGPIVIFPRAGITWSTATAYAIADANTLNTRSLDAWMRMNEAHDVQQLRDAMGSNGMPWVNTIGADRAGNAIYADLSVVPNVSAQMLQRCVPSARAAALFKAADIAVLNGSRSDCAWERDTGAVPGLMPAGKMAAFVTPDYVQNSNDSFWLSAPTTTPPPISPIVGHVGTPQRLRTRSAILEIRGRLAGNDGLPGNRMSVEAVRSVIFRDRNLAGMLVMPDLLDACRKAGTSLTVQAKEGCDVLARWDRTSNIGSAGAPLFREFWRKAKDIPDVWRVPFDPADPVATPSGLKMDDAAVRTAVFQSLDAAVGVVKSAGYPADAALGQVQFRDVRGQRVPLHGGDEFEGVLNKLESQGQPTLAPGGYRVNYGSSYMQAVTFDARGPVAWGLLTYGQGSSADSPHAYDQLALFSRKEWAKRPFHREDVEAQRVGAPLVLKY